MAKCGNCGFEGPDDTMWFLRIAQVFLCEDCLIQFAYQLSNYAKEMLFDSQGES